MWEQIYRKSSFQEDIARHSLAVIDYSIDEHVKLRDDFDVLDESKELHSLKLQEEKILR